MEFFILTVLNSKNKKIVQKKTKYKLFCILWSSICTRKKNMSWVMEYH